MKNAWKTREEMEATRLRQGFGVAEQGRHPGITG